MVVCPKIAHRLIPPGEFDVAQEFFSSTLYLISTWRTSERENYVKYAVKSGKKIFQILGIHVEYASKSMRESPKI